jgi:hypothetical protein
MKTMFPKPTTRKILFFASNLKSVENGTQAACYKSACLDKTDKVGVE